MTNDRLWKMQDIAEYMAVSMDHVKRRIVCLPDFPPAIRLPSAGGGKGHPRWKPEEVRDWLESYRESA